ncbi:MAG: hypothetical protein ACRDN0_39400, partial [Trebonia sp.]
MIVIMQLPDRFDDIDGLRAMLQTISKPDRGRTAMPASRDISVEITANGERYPARQVPARTLLVHFLRDQLGLTGTHVGCDTTQC